LEGNEVGTVQQASFFDFHIRYGRWDIKAKRSHTYGVLIGAPGLGRPQKRIDNPVQVIGALKRLHIDAKSINIEHPKFIPPLVKAVTLLLKPIREGVDKVAQCGKSWLKYNNHGVKAYSIK
jgi:hypothetical protein